MLTVNFQVVEISGNGGLLDATEELRFLPGFNLEGYPNRDSTHYAAAYNITSASTVLRGTIRYKVSHCCKLSHPVLHVPVVCMYVIYVCMHVNVYVCVYISHIVICVHKYQKDK